MLQASRDAEKRIKQLRGRDSISARVEIAQLRSAQGVIREVILSLWREIEKVTRRGQTDASRRALETSFLWDEILLTRAGFTKSERDAMKASLLQTADRGVEAAIARINQSRVPLSSRVYRSRELTTGVLDRRISAAIARGANWKQISNEVRSSIRPDTPGGVAYAAKRLARTELNNAYHAVSVAHNSSKPWNESMGWRISGSHPTPDICDLYADRSPYSLGEVPPKPHPQCLCVTYPIPVSPEEFLRSLRAGNYDEYISSTYGTGSNRVA